MRLPWRDRHGRFLPLKAVVLAAAFVPGLVYAARWLGDDLGSRPLNEAIHGTGLWAVRILMISLAITPFARMLDWTKLLLVRRIAGVSAMTYGLIHLSLYFVDQKFALLTIASEILLRFYLTLGFVALLGLTALGVTSTDAMTRRMGKWWKRLHRLAYPIGVLALWHYFLQSKANVSEPVFVAGLFAWLMAWRALPETWRRGTAVYPVLAVLAGPVTAAIEFAWYGLATRIDPWRVVGASGTLDFGLRPAHWVFITAATAAAIVAGRRIWTRRAGGITGSPSSGPIPSRTGRASSEMPPNRRAPAV